MSLKKKILIVLVFIAVALTTAWFFFGGVDCIALKVKKQDAVKGVTVTGIVKSSEDTQVTTDVTGIIESINVSSGDTVEKGQVLAILNQDEQKGVVKAAQGRLATARAELARDEVDLKDAQRDQERYEKLFGLGAVSEREKEQRTLKAQGLEKQFAETQQQIDAAQGEVVAAQSKLEDFIIKAPISGIITEKYVSTGDVISPSKALFRLVSPQKIYLSMDVEEYELDALHNGQKALVIFDAYPDKVFTEKVYLISKQVNPLTGTFEARLTKPKTDLKILVGMTLDATIVQGEYKNVIIIPTDFITEDDNKTYVFVKSGYFAKKTQIKSEIFDNNTVMVLDGLKEGDIILKRMGTGKLKDNEKVKIKEFRE